MKTVIKYTALIALLIFIVSIFSYHRNKKNSRADILKILINASSANSWTLKNVIYNGTEQELNSCFLNNNRLIFYANGTYIKSSYKCNDGRSSRFAVPQTENGFWQLDEENEMIKLGRHNYKLLSVTPEELVLKNKDTKYYFFKADGKALLNPLQLLTGSKTWKYRNSIIDGLERDLLPTPYPAQILNQYDGSLITYCNKPGTRQKLVGKWIFDPEESMYTIIYPAAGKLPATHQTYSVMELTEKTFVIAFTDEEGKQVELHYVQN